MELKEALYVATVAKHGNVTKAAEELLISQPSLSHYIKKTEESLGIKLFERSNKRLKLTYSGEKYVETAQKILVLNRKLEKELYDIENLNTGMITIGVSGTTGRIVLPGALVNFKRKYPNITVNIFESNPDGLEEATIKAEVDFSILALPSELNPYLEYKTINRGEIFIAHYDGRLLDKSQKHPGSNYPSINLNYLTEENFILLKKNQRLRQFADQQFKASKFKPNVVMETKYLNTAYALMCKGYGVTIIPEETHDRINNPNVQLYSFEHNNPYIDIGVCKLKDGYLSNAAREFISMLFGLYTSRGHHHFPGPGKHGDGSLVCGYKG